MKKTNKKGFTLIELLAVIVILAIIIVMAIASVGAVLNRMRKNAYVVEANTIVKALKNKAVTDTSILPTEEDEEDKIIPLSDIELQNGTKSPYGSAYSEDSYVKIEKLSGVGVYAYSICIVDAKGNGIPETNIDYVTRTSITTDVECSTEPPYYANGTAVYFNPVSGEKCDAASAVSTTGTKTGCMKWYAFLDSEEGAATINLLLDHDTNIASDGVIKWNGGTTLDLSPLNSSGKILWKLKTDTDGWTGVPSRTDNYTLNKGTANYTIDYTGYKARLITALEVATITNITPFNEINPATLFAISSTYTWLCGPNMTSYYTATAAGATVNQAYIWSVLYTSGNLYLYSGTLTGNQLNVGVRPVITIPKFMIE